MTLHRTLVMVSVIAMAINLAACGGGGTPTSLVSAPVPPPAPAPAPVPPAASIGAPAIAAVPNAALFPQASVGGPTFAAHPTTVFPLLQTVVTVSSAGLVADTATISAGATLAFDSDRLDSTMTIGNPAVGISSPSALVPAEWGPPLRNFSEEFWGQTGQKRAAIGFTNAARDNLTWTTYGYWVVIDLTDPDNRPRTSADFVIGFETPSSAIPRSGTAIYTGVAQGQVVRAGSPTYVPVLSGDARLTADFAIGSVDGNLTHMFTTDVDGNKLPWNSVSLHAAFAAGTSSFVGTTAITLSPSASLAGSATGTIAGKFFGPAAQELGAVWTLSDGTSAATGTIGAKMGGP